MLYVLTDMYLQTMYILPVRLIWWKRLRTPIYSSGFRYISLLVMLLQYFHIIITNIIMVALWN